MKPQIPLLLARNTSVSFFPVRTAGIPTGGIQDQFLIKKTNADFDFKFVTLIVSMLTDLLATATELNYSQGVTSSIQAQINALLPLTGGTMSGDIAMGTHKITGLGNGSASTDAVNKGQLDAAGVGLWDDRGSFSAAGGSYPSTGGSGTAGAILKGDIWTISVAGTLPTGQIVEIGDTVRALIDTPGNTQANWSILQNNIGYVPLNKAGDSMSGALAMSSNKITGLAAAISNGDALRYEQLIGLYLLLTGGTMSGTIVMGGNKVTGLAAASANGDAVRFEQLSSYVENNTLISGDLNDAIQGSINHILGDETNAPTGSPSNSFIVTTVKSNAAGIATYQTAIQVQGSGTGNIYSRNKNNSNVWSAWAVINS